MEGITLKRVTEYDEIVGIKKLQNENLKQNLSNEQKTLGGFLTADYTIEFLQEMNEAQPSVVAKAENGEVIGYVLAATKEIAPKHPILVGLMETIIPFSYEEQPIQDLPFIIVGQVCIAKEYRGTGLFYRLYQYFAESMKGKYRCCITEVDDKNQRSVNAHQKCGFQIIHSGESGNNDGVYWHLILWDWSKN